MRCRRFLVALFAGAVMLVSSTTPAGAGIYINTVGDTAELAGAGHRLSATVVVGCEVGERIRFQVTVTQGDTVGIGRGAGRCTGEPDVDVYEVTVAGSRGDTFEPGPAEVQAWAETRHGQHTHPRHEWSKTITVE